MIDTVSIAPNDCAAIEQIAGNGDGVAAESRAARRRRGPALLRRGRGARDATPSIASCRAIVRPSPREPPVMRTDLPVKEKLVARKAGADAPDGEPDAAEGKKN